MPSRRSWLFVIATLTALATSQIQATTNGPQSFKSAVADATAQGGELQSESVPGQYVVRVRGAMNVADLRAMEKRLNVKIVDRVRDDLLLLQLLQPKTDESPTTAVRLLEKDAEVVYAEPNYIYKAFRSPNDPEFGRLWGLKNAGEPDSSGVQGMSGVDINAEKAWDMTTGSDDVVVAVIDTGVDFDHPDLKDNAWTNLAELNGQANVDDDGNGYVDDVHGYDFTRDQGDSFDDNGHGTHCAGTIGARGNDGFGVVGVNWNVKIMAVKFLSASGSGTLANAVKAIDYARKMGAKIHSNSWGGGGFSQALKDAIEATRAADQLFVAAAGNESNDNDESAAYPASYDVDNIVSVAAINNRGDLAGFSNYGTRKVHIAAPGVNIVSTVPGGKYDSYSGTSMATPHVSGVAGLLLAQESNQTYAMLKERMMTYSRPLAGLRGRVSTGGIVDAYHALSRTSAPIDVNDPENWVPRAPYELSTPHPYTDNFTETYTIHVPGATKLSVHFAKFETEPGYDRVQFKDASGQVLGTWSGSNNERFSPAVDGDTVILEFTSDSSTTGYGFDVDFVAYQE